MKARTFIITTSVCFALVAPAAQAAGTSNRLHQTKVQTVLWDKTHKTIVKSKAKACTAKARKAKAGSCTPTPPPTPAPVPVSTETVVGEEFVNPCVDTGLETLPEEIVDNAAAAIAPAAAGATVILEETPVPVEAPAPESFTYPVSA